jgi:hypothetical protein
MKLIVKFNLVFIGVFLLGLVVAGRISYTLLQKRARRNPAECAHHDASRAGHAQLHQQADQALA